jgi:hypothetical protein
MSDPGKPPLAKRVKREMNLHVDIKQLKKSTSFSMDEDAHGDSHFNPTIPWAERFSPAHDAPIRSRSSSQLLFS